MKEDLIITTFIEQNADEVVALVNSAYRGEGSKKGWTTEADLIEGTLRIDKDSLYKMLDRPGSVVLTCKDADTVVGCVYLKKDDEGLYLGMLSVSPSMQGSGTGKKLLQAAEEHAIETGAKYIVMSVIDLRHELIAWYERHGYKRTGETKPFPADDKFGKPRLPMCFVILKKMINA